MNSNLNVLNKTNQTNWILKIEANILRSKKPIKLIKTKRKKELDHQMNPESFLNSIGGLTKK